MSSSGVYAANEATVEVKVLSEAIVLCALHIVSVLPADSRKGNARDRLSSRESSSNANWVRPSLYSLQLPTSPSLVDLVFSLPCIAIGDPGAGGRQVLEKLATLLKAAQEQHHQQQLNADGEGKQSKQHQEITSAGGSPLAVQDVLSRLLAHDVLFQDLPQQTRVASFMQRVAARRLIRTQVTAQQQEMPAGPLACAIGAKAMLTQQRMPALVLEQSPLLMPKTVCKVVRLLLSRQQKSRALLQHTRSPVLVLG
eukprot:gene10734-10890_t